MATKESDDRASQSNNQDHNKQKKPLFVANSSGIGGHPASALGWVILLGAIAVIVCLVIVLRLVL